MSVVTCIVFLSDDELAMDLNENETWFESQLRDEDPEEESEEDKSVETVSTNSTLSLSVDTRHHLSDYFSV